MGFLDAIKNAISLDEDDDDSLYEAEMRELERKERSKNARKASRAAETENDDDEEESAYSRKSQRNSFSERKTSDSGKTAGQLAQEKRKNAASSYRKSSDSSRVMPPRSPETGYSAKRNNTSARRSSDTDNVVKMRKDTSEISIIKVQSFADAQEVCDSLIDGRPIIVSFEDPRGAEAQRIMDFIAGCIYVINGNLHTISDSIFLFSPKGVDVSGDYLNMVQNNGFGIPTFNKMI